VPDADETSSSFDVHSAAGKDYLVLCISKKDGGDLLVFDAKTLDLLWKRAVGASAGLPKQFCFHEVRNVSAVVVFGSTIEALELSTGKPVAAVTLLPSRFKDNSFNHVIRPDGRMIVLAEFIQHEPESTWQRWLQRLLGARDFPGIMRTCAVLDLDAQRIQFRDSLFANDINYRLWVSVDGRHCLVTSMNDGRRMITCWNVPPNKPRYWIAVVLVLSALAFVYQSLKRKRSEAPGGVTT
jgi:hypothetical protein